MKILAQHGDTQLIEYDGGNYAVEYNEPSVSKTLLYTRDYLFAVEYFMVCKKTACVGAHTVSGT